MQESPGGRFYLGFAGQPDQCCRWRGGRTGSLKTRGWGEGGGIFRKVGRFAHTWRTIFTLYKAYAERIQGLPAGSSCTEGINLSVTAQNIVCSNQWYKNWFPRQHFSFVYWDHTSLPTCLLLRSVWTGLTPVPNVVLHSPRTLLLYNQMEKKESKKTWKFTPGKVWDKSVVQQRCVLHRGQQWTSDMNTHRCFSLKKEELLQLKLNENDIFNLP